MKTIELPEDIRIFRERHGACEESLEWTAQNCTSMQDVWNKAMPNWLIWVATRPGVLDDRTLRLYVCWRARQVWHLLTDVSRNAVEVAERFANGDATKEELVTARDTARAAWNAARDAARDAAWDAWNTARDAARDAAWDAACDAAWDAACDAAWDDQAAWLRENAKPCFEVRNE
jgi:hypothetical protein